MTLETTFGIDPLDPYEELKVQRDAEFKHLYPAAQVFGQCTNGNSRLFQAAILWYYEKTEELTAL